MAEADYKARWGLFLLKGLDALLAPLIFISVREEVIFGQFINLSTLQRIEFTAWHFIALGLMAVTLNIVFSLAGMYRFRASGSRPGRLLRTGLAATLASALVLLGAWAMGLSLGAETAPVLFWAAVTLIFLIQRSILFLILDLARQRGRNGPLVVLVGQGPGLDDLVDRLRDRGPAYRLVGYFGEEPAPDMPSRTARPPFLGGLDLFGDYISRNPVDLALVALPFKTHYRRILSIIRICATQGLKTKVMTDLFDLPPGVTSTIDDTAGIPFLTYSATVRSEAAEDLKRFMDLVLSALALVVLSPLYFLVALIILARDGAPVIFVQERVGLNKRRFRMFKFRTMVKNAEAMLASLESKNQMTGATFKMDRDPRVTPVGRVLRRTSLDETPQFLNALTGRMSLVGPRPLSVYDFQKFYSDTHRRRFAAKPGLTGLWQVSGRSDIDFDEWMKLDVFYVDNWSLLLDIRILIQTVRVVLTGKGAY